MNFNQTQNTINNKLTTLLSNLPKPLLLGMYGVPTVIDLEQTLANSILV